MIASLLSTSKATAGILALSSRVRGVHRGPLRAGRILLFAEIGWRVPATTYPGHHEASHDDNEQ